MEQLRGNKKIIDDSEDRELKTIYNNMTFEHFKELKESQERLRAEVEQIQGELDQAIAQIEELKDDKKVAGISLHSLMDRMKNMDSDKQAFEKVKIKLKEFKTQGIFKGIDLDVEEEEDDETVNLLNRLIKLIDQTRADILKRDKEYREFKELHSKNERERKENEKAEIDDLVDEYNKRDDDFHNLEDKYIVLKRDMKKKMIEVNKYKEEMEEALELAKSMKEENRTKNKERKARIKELEEELKHKDQRIIELGIEIEEYLQRTPTKSDTSTEYDSFALVKEKKKVSRLTEEIKKLYDEIDKLNLNLKMGKERNRGASLEKIRNTSVGRKNDS